MLTIRRSFALLALAAMLGGIGLSSSFAAPLPTPEPEKKDPAEKKDPPKADPGLEDFMKRFEKQLENLPSEDAARMKKSLEDLYKRMEAMRNQNPNQPRIMPIQPGGGIRVFPFGRTTEAEGRFGAQISPITKTLEMQLDLPEGQGQVVGPVQKDSAAEKAGLKEHDILLELGGKKVPADANDFQKALEEIKPGTPVDAVVLRKGKKTEVKGLDLPEAPAQPMPPFRIRPGIQIMPINPGQFPIPNMPNIPFQPVPGIPGVIPALPGANVTTIAMTKNGDETTITQTSGDLKIQVTAADKDGKPEVKGITITEDGKETKYETVDKVPDAHQDAVKKLIDMAAGKNQFKFEFQPLP